MAQHDTHMAASYGIAQSSASRGSIWRRIAHHVAPAKRITPCHAPRLHSAALHYARALSFALIMAKSKGAYVALSSSYLGIITLALSMAAWHVAWKQYGIAISCREAYTAHVIMAALSAKMSGCGIVTAHKRWRIKWRPRKKINNNETGRGMFSPAWLA